MHCFPGAKTQFSQYLVAHIRDRVSKCVFAWASSCHSKAPIDTGMTWIRLCTRTPRRQQRFRHRNSIVQGMHTSASEHRRPCKRECTMTSMVRRRKPNPTNRSHGCDMRTLLLDQVLCCVWFTSVRHSKHNCANIDFLISSHPKLAHLVHKQQLHTIITDTVSTNALIPPYTGSQHGTSITGHMRNRLKVPN